MLMCQPFLGEPYQIARRCARLAVRALYAEVALYPKPGLVSFVDSGAHQDMDGRLFFRSLFGLRHYFFQISLCAALGHEPQQLVRWGLQAEQTMYAITRGINTHRGAIFALGIVCASTAKLSVNAPSFSLWQLHHTIIENWASYLAQHHHNNNTHGTLVKAKYAVPDAKQSAIAGYPLVFNTFQDLEVVHNDPLFLGLLAYQRFLLQLDDINVLYRVGFSGLNFARQQIQTAISIDDKKQSIHRAIKIHRLFSQHNISPGGVADMLGLLYFLRALFVGG